MKAAIVGAAGYVARELIGLLVRHPEIELTEAISSSQTGLSVRDFHHDFGVPEKLVFTAELSGNADVVFLCGGHGFSKEFLAANTISESTLIVDLSMDFRNDASWTYGLPEVHKGNVSARVANPGCFATAIQLGILPLAGKSSANWNVHAITGSSGAGQQLQQTSHFSWRNDNLSVYKAFDHQHLLEINHHGAIAAGKQGSNAFPKVDFIPLRGPYTRGIFATLYTETSLTDQEAKELYASYYKDAAFTKLVSSAPDLKQVVATNFCYLHIEVTDGKLLVTSIIDNLLKGAAGQAIENTNAFFGFAPVSGLDLKPSYL